LKKFKSITIRIFKHKLYCLQYLQVFSSAYLSSSKSFNQSLSTKSTSITHKNSAGRKVTILKH